MLKRNLQILVSKELMLIKNRVNIYPMRFFSPQKKKRKIIQIFTNRTKKIGVFFSCVNLTKFAKFWKN
jgi:hypothetical protein